MRRLTIFLVLLAGCGGSSAAVTTTTAEPTTITGPSSFVLTTRSSFTLGDSGIIPKEVKLDGQCGAEKDVGGGTFDFMTPDAQVVIQNQVGAVIATTTLGYGQMGRSGVAPGEEDPHFDCSWTIDLPSGTPAAKFYNVLVGGKQVALASASDIQRPVTLTAP